MRDTGTSLRAIRLIGLALLGYLFVLAWIFHLERMATQDSAFFTWLLIDTHKPYAALGRISSWLAQIVPLLLIHIKAPLDAVLRGYSVSIIGVHLLYFWLVAFRMRDQRAAIALPIALVAGTHLMFYFGISELYQGLSVLLLVWACADRCWKAETEREAWRWALMAFAANVWAGFHHQLLVLPLLFLLVYEGLAYKRFKQPRFLLLAYVLVSWYAVRSGLMPATEYEQARMPTLADILDHSTHLGELASTQHLLAKGLKFKSLLVLVLLSAGVLLAQRKWLLLSWGLAFSAGFIVLILITDRDGGSPIIYENYYPVIAWVWAVVLADRWGTITMSIATKAKWGLLSLVLFIGGVQVWRGHCMASAKVAYLDRLTGYLRANGVKKGFVDEASLPWTYMYGNWALAFESALVSGRYGPTEATTLFCGPTELRSDSMALRGKAFLGPNWMPYWFTSDHLDPSYFLFHRQGYVPVNTTMPDSLLPSLAGTGIRLGVDEDVVRMLPDRFTVVPLRITNGSTIRLASLSADGKPVRFRYRLFDPEGSLYAEHAQDSELEVDVPAGSSYAQGLVVERPVDKGYYRVDVEVTTDAYGPLGIGTSFVIQVGR